MKQDDEYTDVIFRRWPKSQGGDVSALFPLVPWNERGECTSYAHVGQHGAADLAWCISATRPASMREPDTLALYRELRGLGYRLRVLRRSPPWRKVRDALERVTRRSTI